MLHFADRLMGAIEEKISCVVVGLDPRVERLPEELQQKCDGSRESAAQAILEFNREVLEAVAPFAVAVKPQAAFYEALGWEGFRTLEDTIRAAHDMGLLVIADVKRGDIGSTMEAYAQACFGALKADAITVNAYLGSDGIDPLLKFMPQGKGIFVLVKTSNPSSRELQDFDAGDARVYEKMAALVSQWGAQHVGAKGYSSVGAVVGATFPGVVAALREIMPHAIFLLPGYGAQGAGAADCRSAFDADGLGAIVNSSRGIIFAYEEATHTSWQDAVRRAAQKMRDDLETVVNLKPQIPESNNPQAN